MLEKLEATGTLYQHAIQKIAVAQAASTTTPVQQIIKSLNELTTQALAPRLSRPAQGPVPQSASGSVRRTGGQARGPGRRGLSSSTARWRGI